MSDELGQFDAFISYRRSDGTRIATRLRTKLQSYDISRHLTGYARPKLRVFLDTIYERGAHDFYRQNIFPALIRSRHLIVIATPDAVLRPDGDDWMLREISDFRAHRSEDNILVVRAAGEFMDELPGDLGETLPNVQIIDLRGEGTWAALSPIRASRLADEWLKLIAPLFEVHARDMPKLRRDGERAQQARLGMAFGAVVGGLVFAIGVAAFAVNETLKAKAAIDDSLFAIGDLMDKTDRLPSDGATGDLRQVMLSSSCDLFDKLSGGTVPNGYFNERALCDTTRAAAYLRNGDTELAGTIAANLKVAVEAALARSRAPDTEKAYRRLLDYQLVALLGNGEKIGAVALKERLDSHMASLVALNRTTPDSMEFADIVVAHANHLADVAEKAEDYEEARRIKLISLDAIGRTLEALPESAPNYIGNRKDLRLRRVRAQRYLAWLDAMKLKESERALATGADALALLEKLKADLDERIDGHILPDYRWEELLIGEIRGIAYLRLNSAQEALDELGKSLRTIEEIRQSEAVRASMADNLAEREERVRRLLDYARAQAGKPASTAQQ